MTLPASGAITFEMIRAELGRAYPLSLRDTDVLALAGRTSGQTCACPTDFYGKSSAAASSSYNGTSASADQGIGTATADMYFNTVGSVVANIFTTLDGQVNTQQASWWLPNGGTPGNAAWIKATLATGTTPTRGDALGSVLALSTNRFWGHTVTRSGSQGPLTRTCTLLVKIYSDSGGTTEIASGTITITAFAAGGL